jgi:hypothetical protein
MGLYEQDGQPVDLDDQGWIEFFEDQERSLRRELSLQFFTASAAFGRWRSCPAEYRATARRGPRARQSRPAPVRRRGSRRAGAPSGPDDDPSEPEPPGGVAGRGPTAGAAR